MIRCIGCNRPAKLKDRLTGNLFCATPCFYLIEGKKRKILETEDGKGKKTRDICDDEIDPLTLDEFRGMDPKDVIILDEQCFYLPGIYDWVINRENNRNPLTNLPFSAEALFKLEHEASNRYPLNIKVSTFGRNTQNINITKLTSVSMSIRRAVQSYFIELYQILPSMYAALSTMARSMIYPTILMDGNVTIYMVDVLRQYENTQYIDLSPDTDEIVIMFRRLQYDGNGLSTMIIWKHMAQQKGWGTDVFEDMERRIEQTMREDDQRARDVVRLRQIAQENPLPEFNLEDYDGDYMGYIRLNTPLGSEYGLIPWVIYNDTTIGGFYFSLRDNIGDFPLRNPQLDVRPLYEDMPNVENAILIYAGRIYPADQLITELPGFQNGIVITVSTMRQIERQVEDVLHVTIKINDDRIRSDILRNEWRVWNATRYSKTATLRDIENVGGIQNYLNQLEETTGDINWMEENGNVLGDRNRITQHVSIGVQNTVYYYGPITLENARSWYTTLLDASQFHGYSPEDIERFMQTYDTIYILISYDISEE